MSRPCARTIPDKTNAGTGPFPKSVRLLRSVDFRKVYAGGARFSSPLFAAFCLKKPGAAGPRVGLTVPRAFGKAVARNRVKRRMREAVRQQLGGLEPQWEIVINPRRAALAAPFESLRREVQRLFSQCNA